MKLSNATARSVVAAFLVVLLGLPAAVLAADGSAGTNAGGGVTYRDAPDAAGATISLAVKRGAWLGRATRIRGQAEQLAGGTVTLERRVSRRKGWTALKSVDVADDGSFSTRWRPASAGRHRLRARATQASSANTTASVASSTVQHVTVYRRVMATWYGPGFYGNRTACGQRLRRNTLGVAHKKLPCGSKVAIRYGGRSVTVPVIDRGPYAAGMSFDLTRATARRLGVTHTSQIGAAVLAR